MILRKNEMLSKRNRIQNFIIFLNINELVCNSRGQEV